MTLIEQHHFGFITSQAAYPSPLRSPNRAVGNPGCQVRDKTATTTVAALQTKPLLPPCRAVQSLLLPSYQQQYHDLDRIFGFCLRMVSE